MDRSPPREALEFAAATREALARLGGVDLARRAESDPGLRRSLLRPALERLGLLTLAPLTGETETIAAALAVREAGAVACPWPLVATLAAPEGWSALYLVEGSPRRLEHLDLVNRALAAGIDGVTWAVRATGPIEAAPLDPFGVRCSVERLAAPASTPDVMLYLILSAFWTLGALGTVVKQAAGYARQRRQFGGPIGRFGAVRWRLADLALAHTGLEELAAYTLWKHFSGEATTTDALALRVIMLEAAAQVLDHGHQVFAAIGLCDEHDLSILDRHMQATLRRSGGLAHTTASLARGLGEDGFDALFAIAPGDLADPVLARDGQLSSGVKQRDATGWRRAVERDGLG